MESVSYSVVSRLYMAKKLSWGSLFLIGWRNFRRASWMLSGVSSLVLAVTTVSNAPLRVDVDRFRLLLTAHCDTLSRGDGEWGCSVMVREVKTGIHTPHARSSCHLSSICCSCHPGYIKRQATQSDVSTLSELMVIVMEGNNSPQMEIGAVELCSSQESHRCPRRSSRILRALVTAGGLRSGITILESLVLHQRHARPASHWVSMPDRVGR